MARRSKKLNPLVMLGIAVGGYFLVKKFVWKTAAAKQATIDQRNAINTTGGQYVLPPDAT